MYIYVCQENNIDAGVCEYVCAIKREGEKLIFLEELLTNSKLIAELAAQGVRLSAKQLDKWFVSLDIDDEGGKHDKLGLGDILDNYYTNVIRGKEPEYIDFARGVFENDEESVGIGLQELELLCKKTMEFRTKWVNHQLYLLLDPKYIKMNEYTVAFIEQYNRDVAEKNPAIKNYYLSRVMSNKNVKMQTPEDSLSLFLETAETLYANEDSFGNLNPLPELRDLMPCYAGFEDVAIYIDWNSKNLDRNVGGKLKTLQGYEITGKGVGNSGFYENEKDFFERLKNLISDGLKQEIKRAAEKNETMSGLLEMIKGKDVVEDSLRSTLANVLNLDAASLTKEFLIEYLERQVSYHSRIANCTTEQLIGLGYRSCVVDSYLAMICDRVLASFRAHTGLVIGRVSDINDDGDDDDDTLISDDSSDKLDIDANMVILGYRQKELSPTRVAFILNNQLKVFVDGSIAMDSLLTGSDINFITAEKQADKSWITPISNSFAWAEALIKLLRWGDRKVRYLSIEGSSKCLDLENCNLNDLSVVVGAEAFDSTQVVTYGEDNRELKLMSVVYTEPGLPVSDPSITNSTRTIATPIMLLCEKNYRNSNKYSLEVFDLADVHKDYRSGKKTIFGLDLVGDKWVTADGDKTSYISTGKFETALQNDKYGTLNYNIGDSKPAEFTKAVVQLSNSKRIDFSWYKSTLAFLNCSDVKRALATVKTHDKDQIAKLVQDGVIDSKYRSVWTNLVPIRFNQFYLLVSEVMAEKNIAVFNKEGSLLTLEGNNKLVSLEATLAKMDWIEVNKGELNINSNQEEEEEEDTSTPNLFKASESFEKPTSSKEVYAQGFPVYLNDDTTTIPVAFLVPDKQPGIKRFVSTESSVIQSVLAKNVPVAQLKGIVHKSAQGGSLPSGVVIDLDTVIQFKKIFGIDS